MKKKISLISITILTFIININIVNAENLFADFTYPVCGFDYMPSKLPGFTSGLFNLIKILIPIILIIMGMIDFLRAMMAGDDNKTKDAKKRFINRVIAAVIVFLVVAIIQFVFRSIAAGADYKNGFANCMNCLLDNKKEACKGGTNDIRKSCDDYEAKDCPDVDDFGKKCMQYNNGQTYGGCKIKGYNCEDYLPDECPEMTITGTNKCQVIDNVCKKAINCEPYTMMQCDSVSKGACKWSNTENKCVNVNK